MTTKRWITFIIAIIFIMLFGLGLSKLNKTLSGFSLVALALTIGIARFLPTKRDEELEKHQNDAVNLMTRNLVKTCCDQKMVLFIDGNNENR